MNLSQKQNINFKVVLFDFDGTLADTSRGIIDSHKHALKSIGKDVPSDDELLKLIGGNLLDIYSNHFGLGGVKAREAIAIYRDYYSKHGLLNLEFYHGIKELLLWLQDNNILIGIVSLKAELFVKRIIEKNQLVSMFNYVYGMDLSDSYTKSQLIDKCILDNRLDKKEVVYIGDTNGDLQAANKIGVSFIGVTYGFGFKDKNQQLEMCVDEPLEIKKYIMSSCE